MGILVQKKEKDAPGNLAQPFALRGLARKASYWSAMACSSSNTACGSAEGGRNARCQGSYPMLGFLCIVFRTQGGFICFQGSNIPAF